MKELPIVDPVEAGFVTEAMIDSSTNGNLLSLSFSVISINSVTSEDDLIEQTQPKRQGQRNDCILFLARGVKFNLAITDPVAHRRIVRKWHNRALPVIKTKDFDTTWADFLHAYNRAKYPLGTPFLKMAMDKVERGELPREASAYDNPNVKKIVGMCWALAEYGGGNFFLSCHVLAGWLGIAPTQAWRYLRMLEFDGLIKPLDPGNEFRAARFKWCANQTI